MYWTCGLGRPVKLVRLLFASLFLGGCSIQTHDATLDAYRLNENLGPATERVKQQAAKDLACNHLTANVLSGKNVEGAPLGPVWRDYRLQVTGCNKQAVYQIQCWGDRNCLKARQVPDIR